MRDEGGLRFERVSGYRIRVGRVSERSTIHTPVRIRSDAEKYTPYEVVGKPRSRTEDYLDSLVEAVWYFKKLVEIRRRVKRLYTALHHAPLKSIPLIQREIKEAEKEERRTAREFYRARKKVRVLCEAKYSKQYACESCPYRYVCWGRVKE